MCVYSCVRSRVCAHVYVRALVFSVHVHLRVCAFLCHTVCVRVCNHFLPSLILCYFMPACVIPCSRLSVSSVAGLFSSNASLRLPRDSEDSRVLHG